MWLCIDDFSPENENGTNECDFERTKVNGEFDRFEDLLRDIKEAHFCKVSSLRQELREAMHRLKLQKLEDASSVASSLHRSSHARLKDPADDFAVSSALDWVPREREEINGTRLSVGVQVFNPNLGVTQTNCEGKDERETQSFLANGNKNVGRCTRVSFAPKIEQGIESSDLGTYVQAASEAGATRANQRVSRRGVSTAKDVSNRQSVDSALSIENHFESAQFNLWPVWTTNMELTGGRLWRNTFQPKESVQSMEDAVVLEQTQMCVMHSVVSPSAPGRFMWDMIALVLVVYDFVTIPLQVFDPKQGMIAASMTHFSAVYWTIDMIASFFTGFYSNGNIVMDKRQIAANYMQGWFVPDLAVVAADWMILLGDSGGASDAVSSLRFTKFARFLRTIRLMRLAKTRKILQDIRDRIDSDRLNAWFKIFTLLIIILGINHLVGCAWYGLSTWPSGRDGWVAAHDLEFESKEYLYVIALHWSLTQFTPASMSIQPTDALESIFTVVVILFALVVFSSFVSSLTNATSALRNLKEEEYRNLSQLRRYMSRCSITRGLKLRIERYAEYVLKTNMNQIDVTDVKVLKLLSHPLRNELYTELYMESLQGYSLFIYLDLHQALTLRICCTALRPMHLARSDVLFFGGEVAKEVLIVAWGDLQYRRSMDVSCLDVGTGTWVSDQLIWTSWIRLGDMRAITVATVVQIDPHKFANNFKSLPMVWAEAARYGREFVDQLNQAVQDGVEVNDIDHRFFDMTSIGLRKHKTFQSRWSADSAETTRRSEWPGWMSVALSKSIKRRFS